MSPYLAVTVWLHDRLSQLTRRPEAGYSTEAVVVTAILAALALLVLGTIIWNAVVDKAQSIDLG